MSSNQPKTQTNMATSVRNAVSGNIRLKSVVVDILYEIVRAVHWVDWMTSRGQAADTFSRACNF